MIATVTYVQNLRYECVGGLYVRPAELLPEGLDLEEDGAEVDGGRRVLHKVVHGGQVVKLNSLEEEEEMIIVVDFSLSIILASH